MSSDWKMIEAGNYAVLDRKRFMYVKYISGACMIRKGAIEKRRIIVKVLIRIRAVGSKWVEGMQAHASSSRDAEAHWPRPQLQAADGRCRRPLFVAERLRAAELIMSSTSPTDTINANDDMSPQNGSSNTTKRKSDDSAPGQQRSKRNRYISIAWYVS